MNKLSTFLRRHAAAFWYVLTEILPVILKTGKRPMIFSRLTDTDDIICTIPKSGGTGHESTCQ